MEQAYWFGLLGGVLIGLASIVLLLFNGRIAGISGILGGVMSSEKSPSEKGWRAAFLGGLLLGGVVFRFAYPEALPLSFEAPLGLAVAAGLLVGFGTRLGNGCTSGHGVCGIGRLSRRSIVATVTFVAAGAVAVYFVRHVFGL